MDRTKKIALIGAQGYQRQSADLQLDCFPWHKVSDMPNLRDYDVVLLDLLSLDQVGTADVDWSSFFNSLNPQSVAQILAPGGRIIVIGDPRFSVRRRSPNGSQDIEEPFLPWTGVNFSWDNQPGDTVVFEGDWRHSEYEEYVKSLKHWDYSLRSCEVDLEIFGEMYDLEDFRERGVSLDLLEDRFCQNRYGGALAFTIQIAFQRRSRYDVETVHKFGPVVFLPKIDLSEDETLVLVLRDLCGVESALPEPEWVAEFEAPGQKRVDDEIRQIRAQIESLLTELRSAQAKREKARACLKLLYERGEPLETAVRQILRGLGADVEDPETPGKEDGWVTVQVAGETLEGVLEVKSTRNPQFDEQGLRQLLDWINRGVELRQKKYKGIFVGSNSVDEPISERPWAFSDSWMKSAKLHEIVAIKAQDLYVVHILNASGKLDTEEFWRRLLGTRGVFDAAPYMEMLVPKENEREA